jgi:hypothetical protein
METRWLTYRVSLHGSNFVMEMEDGERKRCGFRVQRWIEAPSPADAAREALDLISADPRVRGQLGLALDVQEVVAVRDRPPGGNLSGFMFYDDEDDPD